MENASSGVKESDCTGGESALQEWLGGRQLRMKKITRWETGIRGHHQGHGEQAWHDEKWWRSLISSDRLAPIPQLGRSFERVMEPRHGHFFSK